MFVQQALLLRFWVKPHIRNYDGASSSGLNYSLDLQLANAYR
jgi:hypothetical protein